ncbi:MAG: 4Fe-4S dicluster domain-containing protein [Desulfobacterales bacterium]|nr:4Fe-4S dicluster domain-containing protein [Desulfobacterales bacterium]
MDHINTEKIEFGFLDQIEAMSRANLNRCWHCKACSGGCPFSRDMDVLPNAVIRMVQFGMKKAVLKTSTIWLCVGCNTCSTECPNAIDIAAVMDALRQVALSENVKIAEPGILAFHEAVVDSIGRHGRTHKVEIMMQYKLSGNQLFSDIDTGLKMFSKRKLDLLPSRIKDKSQVRALFKQSGEGA